MKLKIALFFFIFLNLSSEVWAQKAYDVVKYEAKTTDFIFKLAIADGYLEASELKVVDIKTKKTANYTFCTNDEINEGKLKFCANENNKIDVQKNITIAISDTGEPLPAILSGQFINKGKKETLNFTKKTK